MNLRQLKFITITLCFFLTFSMQCINAQENLRDAEEVAVSYMTAFFHGDIETAVSLMHQDTLEDLRDIFLSELNEAKSENRETDFLSKIEIQIDPIHLESMNLHDLAVLLISSNQRTGSSSTLEKMKQVAVNVEQSELVGVNEAIVQLKIAIPEDSTVPSQVAELFLVNKGDVWRVK